LVLLCWCISNIDNSTLKTFLRTYNIFSESIKCSCANHLTTLWPVCADEVRAVATFSPLANIALASSALISLPGLRMLRYAFNIPAKLPRPPRICIPISNGASMDCLLNCNELRTSGRLLDNSARFLLGLTENIAGVLLTLSKNVLALWLLGAFGDKASRGQASMGPGPA